jgi:hypothetical protein
MRDGALSYKSMMSGLHEGKLPEEKITEVLVKKVFMDLKEGEKYALDFKAFLILAKY